MTNTTRSSRSLRRRAATALVAMPLLLGIGASAAQATAAYSQANDVPQFQDHSSALYTCYAEHGVVFETNSKGYTLGLTPAGAQQFDPAAEQFPASSEWANWDYGDEIAAACGLTDATRHTDRERPDQSLSFGTDGQWHRITAAELVDLLDDPDAYVAAQHDRQNAYHAGHAKTQPTRSVAAQRKAAAAKRKAATKRKAAAKRRAAAKRAHR